MITKKSARRVIETYSLKYKSQSLTKKLKSWNSKVEKYIVILKKMLDELKNKRMKNLKQNMLEYNKDVNYYDYDEYDDWSTNAADEIFCSEALNNCWNKSE